MEGVQPSTVFVPTYIPTYQTAWCHVPQDCHLDSANGTSYVIQNIQGDSLARGPKLLSIKHYVNQLTDDELTTGYYQQDGATCHTSNASM